MGKEEFLKAMAKEFAKERLRLGYTQQQFYDETGIHIGRIESSARSIKVETFYRICKYFEIPCSLMMDRIITMNNPEDLL